MAFPSVDELVWHKIAQKWIQISFAPVRVAFKEFCHENVFNEGQTRNIATIPTVAFSSVDELVWPKIA